MCCTVGPAELSDTILYGAEVVKDDKIVHVLGYQNKARNTWGAPPVVKREPSLFERVTSWSMRRDERKAQADGTKLSPNAMVLPFPTSVPMGPENILDTRECKKVLKDLVTSLSPQRRSKSRSIAVTNGDAYDDDDLVEVFESGSYTVVLANSASSYSIKKALTKVPENKRPVISDAFLDAFVETYKDHSIAICCFDGNIGDDAEPLLWWYEPSDPSTLFLPALDAHDGGAPDLKASVHVNHSIVVGSSQCRKGSEGQKAYLSDKVPEAVAPFLIKSGWAETHNRMMPNGDFKVSVESIRKGSPDIKRVSPAR